ncbi:MAG: phosphoribosylformylglycinamidine synthase, partial [Planctomycetes bacterium]|nr:phosphoribosylformylglycinamidine synthase [Planctomycetota bacterium]
RIYLVGWTRAELGASHLHLLHGAAGGEIPRVDLARAPAILARAAAAVRHGLVTAAHDLSEGGLAVALAEMAFSGGFGVTFDLERVPGARAGDTALRTAEILFSESPTRLLFEVPPERAAAFEAHWAGWPAAAIGETTAQPVLVARRGPGRPVFEAALDRLEKAWQTPLIR